MLRALLEFVLLAFAARAFWLVLGGVIQGLAGPPRPPGGGKPFERRARMARDPVCGTFVVPERSLTLTAGSEHIFFCSVACRDAYRARSAADRHPPSNAVGRGARP